MGEHGFREAKTQIWGWLQMTIMSYLTSLFMTKMMSDVDKMSINVCYNIHIESMSACECNVNM